MAKGLITVAPWVLATLAAAPVFAAAPPSPAAAHPQQACIKEIQAERGSFQKIMEGGIKSGRIDAKEHAALDQTHANLLAMENKALADKNLSADECKVIHARMAEERMRLQAALAAPAPPSACLQEVVRERSAYQATLQSGIKSGTIDPKEHARLNKTHADLMALESKAMANKNLSPAECKAIHDRILEEHKLLQAAVAKGPGPAATPAAVKK